MTKLPVNFSAEWRAGQTVDPNVDLYSADGMEFLLYKTTKEMYDQYDMDDYALPALKLTLPEAGPLSLFAAVLAVIRRLIGLCHL